MIIRKEVWRIEAREKGRSPRELKLRGPFWPNGDAQDKDGYQYEYDYENRITKIIKSGPTTVAEFAYDALGRRIKKRDSIANTNNIYYYNDNWQILCDYNDAGTPQSWFAYGNYIDEAVLMSKSFTSWLSARYYIHDHLYSPAALMGSTGSAPIERYEYDAYGNCYILEPNLAPDPDNKSDYGNPYAFQGKDLDLLDGGELQVMHWPYRDYSTYLGRWLEPEKLGMIPNDEESRNPFSPLTQYANGMNLYEVVGSQPVSNLDPNGLWGKDTHYTRTYSWAAGDNGMKAWAARQVASSDNGVDPLIWPIHTTAATLSWHFNIPHNATLLWASTDSRYVHAERQLGMAINVCGDPKVNCLTARLAVSFLGQALHPVQDWFAHGTWDPTWKSRVNWRMHPPGSDEADKDYKYSADKILRDPVRDGRPAHPIPLFQTGSTRIIGTKHRTLEYLARFKNSLNKQGLCYCFIYGKD